MTLVKICGLITPETLDAALDGGAAFVGAVVYPKSPTSGASARGDPVRPGPGAGEGGGGDGGCR